MLNNKNFYSEIDEKADLMTQKELNEFVNQHGKDIVKEESAYLTNFEISPCYFRDHQKNNSKEIQNAKKNEQTSEYLKNSPDDLKFRPIVGVPSNVTQRLSHLIDLTCQEVLSFIRDDLDFLNYLPENIEDTVLVTLDVVNLYTNIPRYFGLRAIQY